MKDVGGLVGQSRVGVCCVGTKQCAGQPRQRGLPQTRLPPSGAGNKTSCMEEAGA